MSRYKGVLEYCGTNYYGMQKQNGFRTIQGSVEFALSQFLNSDTTIEYCGRTDAGVHAFGQVIHFDTNVIRSEYNFLNGINYYLHKDEIILKSIRCVDDNFHSRFDARRRWYLYKVINRNVPLTIDRNTHLLIRDTIDVGKMKEAGNYLIGTHDFSAFRNNNGNEVDHVRTVYAIDIISNGEEIHFYCCAKSFLYNMVRNIVGSLLEVGLGHKDSQWINDVLQSRDRSIAGPKVAACGLYFLRAEY